MLGLEVKYIYRHDYENGANREICIVFLAWNGRSRTISGKTLRVQSPNQWSLLTLDLLFIFRQTASSAALEGAGRTVFSCNDMYNSWLILHSDTKDRPAGYVDLRVSRLGRQPLGWCAVVWSIGWSALCAMHRAARLQRELRMLSEDPPHGASCWLVPDSTSELEARE